LRAALAWLEKSSQLTILIAIALGLMGAGFSGAKIKTQLVASPVLGRP
jgi:hypothetical protein